MTQRLAPIDCFIKRWQGREGGQERANYALFLSELCDVIGVTRPDPATANTEQNDYVLERAVKRPSPDGTCGTGRIDLYKKNCFILEAKQSRQAQGDKQIHHPALPGLEPAKRGVRDASRFLGCADAQRPPPGRGLCPRAPRDPWLAALHPGLRRRPRDRGLRRLLRPGKKLRAVPRPPVLPHLPRRPAPPGNPQTSRRHLDQPDATRPGQGNRQGNTRHRRTPRRRIESNGRARARRRTGRDVPHALPVHHVRLLERDRVAAPRQLSRPAGTLRKGPLPLRPDGRAIMGGDGQRRFCLRPATRVRRFNGEFFKTRTVLPLGREEIGELRIAASFDWREVDPSIFGTLLEQALDKTERRRLGAFYTPRAYVERLVVATVIEPLRLDWEQALSVAERQKSASRGKEAIATVQKFHDKLCHTRTLDPACGTGNFLYVAFELLKRLEGEVLEALTNLGGQEAITGLASHTVNPCQFLGLEVNPRAAAIAELVLWIGYLQWHFRTQDGMPSEPILHAYRNIQDRFDAVLTADIDLKRDARGKPVIRTTAGGKHTEVHRYNNPRQPEWPEAEFIVGNPPFIGGKDIRERLGDDYALALWAAHPAMNESADFVMYWWDHAALLLTSKDTALRRFGLITTNSISQVFQRRVMERHFGAKDPISLVLAIPDHPWTKATKEAAAVRIAMTVAEAGSRQGLLRPVLRENGLDTDAPEIDLAEISGRINSDLTVGIDVSQTLTLQANEGICSRGMALHGAGFIVTPQVAKHLGLGRRLGLEEHIREYRHGRDLTSRPRGVMVIDLDGLEIAEVRQRFPEVYQHLLVHVKPERDTNHEEYRRANWWLFGRRNTLVRGFISGIHRYIATVETAKHRVFQFLDASILPDNMLVAIGADDAFILGVLSARVHKTWVESNAASIGVYVGNVRYTKSKCFDPFPFPAANDLQKQSIRAIAEDLDVHRKRVLAEHPHLTLTGLYNVLEKLRSGTRPDDLDTDDLRTFDDGLVLILQEHHDRLDAAVAQAYGWPADLPDNEILARLVALNRQRANEEAAGHVRWLRSDYQIPRFGAVTEKLHLTGGTTQQPQATADSQPKPSFPSSELEQTVRVMDALYGATEPLSPAIVASRFRQGRRILPQIEATIAAMVRVGSLVYSPDGGRTFLPRRAA